MVNFEIVPIFVIIFEKFFTRRSTIGTRIDAIEVFDANSVDIAPKNIIIRSVSSFFSKTMFFKTSPITSDSPDF